MTILERTTFEMSRASEYFDVAELQKMTGLTRDRFGEAVVKELVDNSLDACESANVAPEILLHTETLDEETLAIGVRDNGNGIPPETVRRILNFATRTSDKAVYRAPTRGLQGNALKTVLGMPFACGVDAPVLVEACGIRHLIRAWTDPAGELQIEHEEEPQDTEGTRIVVVLPRGRFPLKTSKWGRAFSLFNPHALVQIRDVEDDSYHANSGKTETGDLYQIHHPTVDFLKPWRKFLPTDFTSPSWYDTDAFKRLVFSHIAAAKRGSRDLTLREFVRQFRGLTPTGAAKKVCEQFPEIPRLSSFEDRPEMVDLLLFTMRRCAKAPTPNVLGLVGEHHFRAKFDQWYGVKRFWYRKATGMSGTIPFTVEVAVAETETAGELFYGTNFSPTFDASVQTHLDCGEIKAFGVEGFLEHGYTHPGLSNNLAVAFHLTSPVLETLDRGKTRIHVTPEMADSIAKTLWGVVKELYREGKAREKDAAKQEREDERRNREEEDRRLKIERAQKVTLKDAVFQIMPEAVIAASGADQFPFSARSLYYQVRPLIQRHTSDELTMTYFSDLLVQYRDAYGPIKGLYYEPRGTLYEPHSDQKVELGTREVYDYQFPAWQFDKILYIEKTGLWPVVSASRIGQRYDMAIVAGQGYATEACRELFSKASKDHNYKLFVLHDADPAGYNIARTLREETRRMPGYHVDVVDMGLAVDTAIEMGLESEEFTRRKKLPQGLVLSKMERRWFEGRRASSKSWICRRVELNAMSSPQLIEYIEDHLAAHDATAKVVPPNNVILSELDIQCRAAIRVILQDALEEMVDKDGITDKLTPRLYDTLTDIDGPSLTDDLEKNRVWSWRDALRRKVTEERLSQGDELSTAIQEAILEAVTEHQTNGVNDSGTNGHD